MLKGELIHLTTVFPSRNSGFVVSKGFSRIHKRRVQSDIRVQAQLMYRHAPAAHEKTMAVLESSGGFGTLPNHHQPLQSSTAGSFSQKVALTIIILPTLFSLEHALFVTNVLTQDKGKRHAWLLGKRLLLIF